MEFKPKKLLDNQERLHRSPRWAVLFDEQVPLWVRLVLLFEAHPELAKATVRQLADVMLVPKPGCSKVDDRQIDNLRKALKKIETDRLLGAVDIEDSRRQALRDLTGYNYANPTFLAEKRAERIDAKAFPAVPYWNNGLFAWWPQLLDLADPVVAEWWKARFVATVDARDGEWLKITNPSERYGAYLVACQELVKGDPDSLNPMGWLLSKSTRAKLDMTRLQTIREALLPVLASGQTIEGEHAHRQASPLRLVAIDDALTEVLEES
jgi:hypothetical protein